MGHLVTLIQNLLSLVMQPVLRCMLKRLSSNHIFVFTVIMARSFSWFPFVINRKTKVLQSVGFSTNLLFFQIFDTSDLPGGVVNIVTGDRDHLTKYLTEHQDVQAMWYFGSAEGSKFVEWSSAVNVKRTFVNYGQSRDWFDNAQGHGEEFLFHSTECKNIWLPMGDIFAN